MTPPPHPNVVGSSAEEKGWGLLQLAECSSSMCKASGLVPSSGPRPSRWRE